MRGAPDHYDELKKQHGIWLTDTTWKWLQLAAKDSGVSVGEYIESWVRKQASGICSRSVAVSQGAIHPPPESSLSVAFGQVGEFRPLKLPLFC
ncbi:MULTISPECIES: hypothetical protein [unclassified Moorena]|nr:MULTISPECIES: hypothetical protein [unclassified Moorena]